MTGLPLAAGRMGMMATPMQSISQSNSLNNKTKPGLLKYLKTTYNNLPNEQKNLLKNLAHGDIVTPFKLYTYNSLAEYPYTYNASILLPNFIPFGNSPADKLKDTIRRASSVPDFDSIKKFNLDRLAEHNNSFPMQQQSMNYGWGKYKNLASTEVEPSGIIDYVIPSSLVFRKGVKFTVPNAVSQQIDNSIFKKNTAQRRELLARFLGVYDKSKGSFFNETPIETIDPTVQKYFKQENAGNTILTPKPYTLNPISNADLESLVTNKINKNPTKSNSYPFLHTGVLGNFTAHYNPNTKTVAAFDTFDFKPNGASYPGEGPLSRIGRYISTYMGKPIPIYKEYDVSKFVKNKDNK